MSIAAHNGRRNLNLVSLGALDLRTCKKDGSPWDFRLKSDRDLAWSLINSESPDWVVGAPPCVAFCRWNQNINFKRLKPEDVAAMMAEARVHLEFMASIYVHQIRQGK